MSRLLCLLILLAGCFSSSTGPTISKEAAREMRGRSATGVDLCLENGWYGDGICDDFCPERDPDCDRTCPDPDPADPRVRYIAMSSDACEGTGENPCESSERFFSNECGCGCIQLEAPSCPDPDAPNVHYAARTNAECAVIDYACDVGQRAFEIDGCGCGCIDVDPECHDPSDPNVRYLAEDPDVCAVIDVACQPNETYFSDPCGCGCTRNPSCADPAEPGVRYIGFTADECADGLWDCLRGETRFDDACGCGCRPLPSAECAGRTEAYCATDPGCDTQFTELCDCVCPPHERFSGGGCDGCEAGCFIYDGCVAAETLRCPNPERPGVEYAGYNPAECAAVDYFCDDASLDFDNACGCGCYQL